MKNNFDLILASIIRVLYFCNRDQNISINEELSKLIFKLGNEPELKKYPLISAVIQNLKIEELCNEIMVNEITENLKK